MGHPFLIARSTLLTAALLVAACAVGLAPATGAAASLRVASRAVAPRTSPAWSAATVIDPLQGDPQSVACLGAGECFAGDGSSNVWTYDGSSWSATNVGYTSGVAPAIACDETAGVCAGAGGGYGGAWTGGDWPQFTDISGYYTGPVSCGPTTCTVGDVGGGVAVYTDASATWASRVSIDSHGIVSLACSPTGQFCLAVDSDGDYLTESGGSWTAPAALSEGTAFGPASCATTSWCVVFSYGTAYVYSKGSWSSGDDVDTSGTVDAVSCTAANACTAVDDEGNVVTDTGGTWTTKAVTSAGDLTGVSCTSATFCLAVNAAGDSLRFNGSSWSAPALFDPEQGNPVALSCPTATDCVALDGEGNAVDLSATGWSAPTSIAPSTTHWGAVSCPTTTFCAALADGGGAATESGGTWSGLDVVDSGNLPMALSCVSSSFCMAVDAAGNALEYDGGSWSVTSITASTDLLDGVSCASTTFCVAVDDEGNAFSYTGSSWHEETGVADGGFSGVSCPSASWCTAGSDSGDSVLTFNGSTWSALLPLPSTTNPFPPSVEQIDCPAVDSCYVLDTSGNWFSEVAGEWTVTAHSPVYDISCPTVATCVGVDSTSAFSWSAPQQSTTVISGLSGGDEVGGPITISVLVSGPEVAAGAASPTGSVVVSDGNHSCTAALTPSAGASTGKCSITETALGRYGFTASYAGDGVFDSSASATPDELTVVKDTSTTTLTASPKKAVEGKEKSVTLSVKVVAAHRSVPVTGKVVIDHGTSVVCTVTLASGTGRCHPSDSALAAGTAKLTATYAGDTLVDGSKSAAVTLTIAR